MSKKELIERLREIADGIESGIYRPCSSGLVYDTDDSSEEINIQLTYKLDID